jgi:hypothetical protein
MKAAMKNMMARLRRFAHRTRSERGATLVMVGGAMAMVFGFAALAVDGAILMVTRTQLSNAADAAALAGATALIGGDQAEAVNRAVQFAGLNTAFEQKQTAVEITPNDITFPAPDEIRVVTHRTGAQGVRTYFLRMIGGPNAANMTAAATAKVYDICSSRCIKPWAIPDRWDDTNGNGFWEPGEYYDVENTGYIAPRDVGEPAILKLGSPHETAVPGIFYAVNFPPLDSGDGKPLPGASWYKSWIEGCSPYLVSVGDRLQLEPGRMVGPTDQGVRELISRDPGAYWDPATRTVQGSAFAQSPRVGLIPFFDPTLSPAPGRNYVTVAKLGAFFIESIDQNNDVRGRFIQITTQGRPCGGGSGTSFVKNIVLVE